jgi:predicted nucleic acid-binding protein
MSSNNIFVLDTNVFVEAHRRYYSFDIVPSFWRTLLKHAKDGQVISIDRVKKEISNSSDDDELKKWAIKEFNEWFMSTDNEIVFESYRQIIDWANNQSQYYDYAKSEFASVADSWLVAYAKAYNYVVVTHESYHPDSKRRIYIPNACHAFGVPYINTFDMLRKLKANLG